MTNIEMVKKLGKAEGFVMGTRLYTDDRAWENMKNLEDLCFIRPDGKTAKMFKEAVEAGDEGRYPLIEKYLKSAIENLTEVLDEIQKQKIVINSVFRHKEVFIDPYHSPGRILFENGFATDNGERIAINGHYLDKQEAWEPIKKCAAYKEGGRNCITLVMKKINV